CIDARWIIPIRPEGALDHHTLVVDRGRIVAVVPTASAEHDFAPRERVSLSAHALLPGLVNAHTHAAMTLLRGIADDVALKPWLEEHIWPAKDVSFLRNSCTMGRSWRRARCCSAGSLASRTSTFFPTQPRPGTGRAGSGAST